MRVILKGVHLTLDERIKAYVQEHLVEPVERFYDDEAAELNIHLVDDNGPKGGADKECRVTAFIPGSASLHIAERSEDILKSICFARDRLEKALKREQGRKQDAASHAPVRPATEYGLALGTLPDDVPLE